jgi:hypothetical protein
MNSKEKQEFLKQGGTLLKVQARGKKHVLRKKTIAQDWHDGITNADETILNNTIDKLIANHPTKFQRDTAKKSLPDCKVESNS